MDNVLLNNSYLILGLDNTVTQKEIIKRSKDILNLLAIDEKPEYDLDLGIFNQLRTESKVKEAAQNLAIPKKRIIEYFFGFAIEDSIDEKAMSLIRGLNFSGARDIWKEATEKDDPKVIFYKKNLALLDLWILYEKETHFVLKESVDLWKELFESEKFWEAYSKIYKLNDDLNSDQEVINDFRKEIPPILSDIYTDFGKKNGTKTYLNEFVRAFGSRGEQLDKTVLTPLHQKINNALDKLDGIEIKSGEILDKSELDKIKGSIKEIQDGFNEIIELGLYEDSQTKVLRDKAATAIMRISLDFNNNIIEYKAALKFMDIAFSLAGTALLKDKINDNLLIIKGNVAGLELNDVWDLVKENKFEEAIRIVNSKLENEKLSKDARLQLEEFKKNYEERIRTQGRPIGSAPTMYCINGCGTRIYGDTLYFVLLFIPVLPLARYSVTDLGNGTYSFSGKLELYKWQKIWKYIGLGIVALLILSAVFSSSNSTSSATTSNSSINNSSPIDCSNVGSGQYCCSHANSIQADSLKPDNTEETRLDKLNTKISNDRLFVDNTNQYALDMFNAEVDKYNQDKNAYNKKTEQYNNFLSQNCTLK